MKSYKFSELPEDIQLKVIEEEHNRDINYYSQNNINFHMIHLFLLETDDYIYYDIEGNVIKRVPFKWKKISWKNYESQSRNKNN